jgi:hypothetical protein
MKIRLDELENMHFFDPDSGPRKWTSHFFSLDSQNRTFDYSWVIFASFLISLILLCLLLRTKLT